MQSLSPRNTQKAGKKTLFRGFRVFSGEKLLTRIALILGTRLSDGCKPLTAEYAEGAEKESVFRGFRVFSGEKLLTRSH